MLTFLLTIVVLSALIYTGYRLTMYLYSQGVVGTRSRTMRPTESTNMESFSIEALQRMSTRERDEVFHPLRVAIVLFVGLVVLLVVLVANALLSVGH